jgi:hypothetical protein
MALGIAAMSLFGLEARGVESVGLIPRGFRRSSSRTFRCLPSCGLELQASRS